MTAITRGTPAWSQLPLWLKWVGVNAVFSLCHPSLTGTLGALPPPLQSLAVNAMLFLLPATGWSMLLAPATRICLRLARDVAVSSAVFSVKVLELTLKQELAWNTICLVTNLGFGRAA